MQPNLILKLVIDAPAPAIPSCFVSLTLNIYFQICFIAKTCFVQNYKPSYFKIYFQVLLTSAKQCIKKLFELISSTDNFEPFIGDFIIKK